MAPPLTYQDLAAIFETVKIDVGRLYKQFAQLHDELQTQLDAGIAECKCGVENRNYEKRPARAPANLLLARLRGERLVFDAFNKHRLGQATWLYYKNILVPADVHDLLAELGENIAEDLESFPLRLETVVNGFDTFTNNLEPIHHGLGRAAGSSGKSGPFSRKSKSAVKSRTSHYGKLGDAPPANLAYPVGNITLAEMAAFHPDAIKSRDIIRRFLHNGGTQALFADMINHYRVMERGSITNNTILHSMMSTMKKLPGNYKWTPGAEKLRVPPGGFAATSVSVTGFVHSGNGKNTATAAPIPIQDMANGVHIFPSGDDALDLTRAITYCVSHPGEGWMYPDDLQRLVSQLPHEIDVDSPPIGPIPVRPEHHDDATIMRFKNARTARRGNARGRRSGANEDSEEESNAVKRDSDTDSNDDPGKPRPPVNGKRKRSPSRFNSEKSSGSSHKPATGKKPQLMTEKNEKAASKSRVSRGTNRVTRAPLPREASVIDWDSDSDVYIGPKRTEKPVAGPRRSTRASKVMKTYKISEAFRISDDEEEDKDEDEN
jgi:hypothetical protein